MKILPRIRITLERSHKIVGRRRGLNVDLKFLGRFFSKIIMAEKTFHGSFSFH
jgi:hypothetical protein